MRIAFNPSTVAALTTPPNNKDITFDLRGRNIFARGVKFQGTDTNTWRPVVDSLTSDSTTSSLSAKQGKILAGLINNKSDSGHNHDDRYIKKVGGIPTSAYDLIITPTNLSGDGYVDVGGGIHVKAHTGTPFQLWLHDISNVWYKKTGDGAWKKMDAGYADIAGSVAWANVTGKPSSYTPSAHTHAWNSLTHSSTTANQAILTNGSVNGWKLYTLNISAWDNAANNAHSHSNKAILDGITSALVSSWNTAYNFVDKITKADTDKVINKWDEIVNFLAGIDSNNKLNTLLNSKLSIQQLAANDILTTKTNNALFWVNTMGTAGNIPTGPFTDHPYALLSVTNYSQNDTNSKFFYRSRLAFSSIGDIKVASCHHQNEYKQDETWYNVLTSKNSGISGSTIKLNGTSITVYSSGTADGRYVKKSGDTMSGALNFANGTWNLVGDDSYMGDCNISGHFGIKAANTTYPGIAFFNNANTYLGKLTAYSGNIKYGSYSLQFLDNGNTSVSASTWTNPFSAYDENAVGNGQAICVWGQSSYLSNLSTDTGDMTLWLKRVDANFATLNMVLDGEYYASGNQRLAHVSEIPSSLKNPYALTISLNGTSQGPYDGSAAKSINITAASIGAATSGHTHDDRYLKLTGGTMTGTIYRRSGGSTISGRNNAIIRQTYAPGGSSWNPIACVDTETGTWTLGHLSQGSSNTDFHFCFSTNADYNAGSNNGNYVTLRNIAGIIALTSDIPNKNSWNYDDRYYTKAESNTKYITDITTSVNKLTFTRNGSNIDRTITVNNVQSLGRRSPLTERNAISGIYTYGTYSKENNLAPTYYFETLGFGEGTEGTIEIGGSWISGGQLYWRALRDVSDNWFSWKTILDSSNYSGILDSRYYTESEVNSLLSNKLNTSNFNWTNLPGKIVAGNEFNIVNAGFKDGIWFNYLPINDRSNPATINGYHFGNGNKGYTYIVASGFIKNGSNSSYVLLGDGDHKLESALRVAYATNADMVDNYHILNDSRQIYKHDYTVDSPAGSWILIKFPAWNAVNEIISIDGWGDNRQAHCVVHCGSRNQGIWGYQSDYNGTVVDRIRWRENDSGKYAIVALINKGITSLSIRATNYLEISKTTEDVNAFTITSSFFSSGGFFHGHVDWDNIIGKPSAFTPAEHTHTVFRNNLMIKGTNGISDIASIHLGIGDSDTGFRWISDGVCQIYANNVAIGQWTSVGMNWFRNPTVNGNKVWNAGNDGSGSGLDADLLDGQHADKYIMVPTTIDASTLDVNTYYPVTIWLPTKNTRIEVEVSLDSGTKPSWSTHNSGFTTRKVWESNGSGWGTTSIERNIFVSVYSFASEDPVRGIGQLTNSSIEYVYVRGGGKYFFKVSVGSGTPTLQKATYTTNNQSIAPTKTAPALITPCINTPHKNVTLWGQNFNGTNNVSGTLSGVANIQFSANNAYDIGSNSAASRYIYTSWLGAGTGQKLELGANNSSFGQGLCIDTNLNVGIGTNSPSQKLVVVGNIKATGQIIREGSSQAWVNGRNGALLRETSVSGYHALWSLKTTNGSWDFGEYNAGSGWNNVPVLSYITDSNYNSGNNTPTHQIRFPLDSGTVALTKNIPTSLPANGGNADTVDGKHASDFASSSHNHDGRYAISENYGGFTRTSRLPISGFYQSYGSTSGGNAPWVSWMHLINCQHSNTDNNYALQIAASFYDNNTFKIRVTNDNVNNAWRDIIHSGNIGAQSVNYANSAGNADKVDGYHATDGRTFNGDINWGSWNDAWSDGTHAHPWYGFDHRYPNTGAYSTTITDYFGMTIKTANTLRLDFRTLLLNGTSIYDINVASATNAYHLRINSANSWSTWNWSGQGGQPTWLWGSNDGTNMYVWNPSNFSVNYANSAGSATKVIVNQHIANDINYPLVWSNQANTNSATENQLFKSWADLYYNPKNKRLCVAGSAIIGASAVPSYTLDVRGNIIADTWLRTRGEGGWYSESYGGGIWMWESSWIRTYGNKGFYCDNQIYSSNSIRMNDIYLQNTNQINNGANGKLHLNYQNTGNVTICNGGGAVTIGSTSDDIGNNKLYVNGSEFINGASNVRNHVYADGFRHRSHNSNDSVLLAGGGYSQGVPVRYWAIYSVYIGNSSTDVTYTRRSGNYSFISDKSYEVEGVAIFEINFPSGYNKNNTLIFGNGDHRTSSSWRTPVYVTITTHNGFSSNTNIRVMIADDSSFNAGFANIYFMCMG